MRSLGRQSNPAIQQSTIAGGGRGNSLLGSACK
jgi:hypothetical protein